MGYAVGHDGRMRHLEILKGRTLIVTVVWLAAEAAGRDLTAGGTTLTFGLRRNPEDAELALVAAGTATGVNSASFTLTDEVTGAAELALGRYSWGASATFGDGTHFQLDGGSALVAKPTP